MGTTIMFMVMIYRVLRITTPHLWSFYPYRLHTTPQLFFRARKPWLNVHGGGGSYPLDYSAPSLQLYLAWQRGSSVETG